MQNENLESKNTQIKRNPTRFNKNINRGQNEKSVDEENASGGNFKVDPSKYSADQDYLGGTGEFNPGGGESAEFHGGPEAGDYDSDEGTITERKQGGKDAQTTKGVQKEQQQSQHQSGEPLGKEKNEANQAGAGADYGAPSKRKEDQKGEDLLRADERGADEDKQMEGGTNKGGQIPGAFGNEKKGPSPDQLQEGM